jgi:hypothetical protein
MGSSGNSLPTEAERKQQRLIQLRESWRYIKAVRPMPAILTEPYDRYEKKQLREEWKRRDPERVGRMAAITFNSSSAPKIIGYLRELDAEAGGTSVQGWGPSVPKPVVIAQVGQPKLIPLEPKPAPRESRSVECICANIRAYLACLEVTGDRKLLELIGEEARR